MSRDTELDALIRPVAEAGGYRLVRVRMMGGTHRPTLQVMAERIADGGMNVEDCTVLSRALSEMLDAADPIAGGYALEVSSPGIDRPLVALEDFARFTGHEARLELRGTLDGRKRLRGDIAGVDDGAVLITLATREGPETRAVPFPWIADAKLMLTDRLIAESLKSRSTADEAAAGEGDEMTIDGQRTAERLRPARKPRKGQ